VSFSNEIDRGTMAARAWLYFLHATTMDSWQQQWNLEEMYRLPSEPA
jgi:hypothetical protein